MKNLKAVLPCSVRLLDATTKFVISTLVIGAMTSAFVVFLAGCNPAGIDERPGPGKSIMTTVSEDDYAADNAKLNHGEESLKALGLQFQKPSGSKELVWDESYRSSFAKQNSGSKTPETVAALKEFLKTLNEYLKKYGSSPFHLTHKDGSDEIKALDESSKALRAAQVTLVKAELKKLNPKP